VPQLTQSHMTDEKQNPQEWIVTERRPVTELVADPAFAPYLVPEQKVRFRATCPQGHVLPFTLSMGEDVFRAVDSVTWGCGECGANYRLPLGNWPSEFPPLRLPERRV
jgi:hypothetical protein